ncbi:toxin [Desulfococcus sp.]|uniref:toxin n=1 Tax=Desulfococcus sp. TaxID=2025834 RepID=UPI003594193B
MKPFDWNDKKNQWLIRERDISFEQVVLSIENGKLLDVIQHPNSVKYNRQRVYVIEIEGYAYMVPFVEEEDVIFLKTIFPSRRYTAIYLKKDES